MNCCRNEEAEKVPELRNKPIAMVVENQPITVPTLKSANEKTISAIVNTLEKIVVEVSPASTTVEEDISEFIFEGVKIGKRGGGKLKRYLSFNGGQEVSVLKSPDEKKGPEMETYKFMVDVSVKSVSDEEVVLVFSSKGKSNSTIITVSKDSNKHFSTLRYFCNVLTLLP